MKTIIKIILLLFLCKISFSQPTLQWQKCYGGTYNEGANSIQQTTDNGYIFIGNTSSNDGDVSGFHYPGLSDIWVVKTDSSLQIQWQKCIGGSDQDVGYSIQQTTDSGYVLCGYVFSNDGDVLGLNHGGTDGLIVKLSANGTIEWLKCLGGSTYDEFHSVIQTIDGGYIATGYTMSNDGDVSGNHGNQDVWVVKLDSGGNLLWQKCFGGSSSDNGNSIIQTSDGGYIIAASSYSNNYDVSSNHDPTGSKGDYWITKINNTGSIQWSKCYGGSDNEIPYSIKQTMDGGFIIAGATLSNDGDVTGYHIGTDPTDCWIVKIDNVGNLQWEHCYGGGSTDRAFSILQTNDGSYIFTGDTKSNDYDVSGNHGLWDMWVVKLNGSGQLLWQKCFGGSNSDGGYSINNTIDGGYILASTAWSNDGDVSGHHDPTQQNNDVWVVKLGPDTTVSIPEILENSNFSVYPNPANEVISIQCSVFSNKTAGRYRIYDVMGQMLLKGTFGKKEFQVNISSLSKGVYLLKVENEEGMGVRRFVKE